MALGFPIRIENIYFKYKKLKNWIFKDTSLYVKPSEKILIIGPNGSGKSTLFKLITGLYIPDYGEIFLNEKAPHKLTWKERQLISVVSEHLVMPRWVKVKDYISSIGEIRGCNGVPYEIIEQLELSKYMERKISELSQGFKKRVALASAFICNPKLVILDEPVSNVDPPTIVTIGEFLENIRGPTLLVASHITINASWDKLIVISGGKLNEYKWSEAQLVYAEMKCVSGRIAGTFKLDKLFIYAKNDCKLENAQCLDPVLYLIKILKDKQKS